MTHLPPHSDVIIILNYYYQNPIFVISLIDAYLSLNDDAHNTFSP